MGYHVVDPEDLDPLPDRPSDARSISDATGLSNLGLRVYTAEPGEQLPMAYHSHDEQEEAFYVVEGILSVETPEGVFTADEGQLFVVEPESPTRAHNDPDADGPLRVVAVGAPPVHDRQLYDPDS